MCIAKRELRLYITAGILCLLTLYMLHPLLHEVGHALGAWMCGLHVERIQLFPECCTIVNTGDASGGVQFFVAGMGWIFPMILSMVRPKSFREAAIVLPLRAMVLVTAAGELVSMVRYTMGSYDPHSDMTNVLACTDVSEYAVLGLMISIAASEAVAFTMGVMRLGGCGVRPRNRNLILHTRE